MINFNMYLLCIQHCKYSIYGNNDEYIRRKDKVERGSAKVPNSHGTWSGGGGASSDGRARITVKTVTSKAGKWMHSVCTHRIEPLRALRRLRTFRSLIMRPCVLAQVVLWLHGAQQWLECRSSPSAPEVFHAWCNRWHLHHPWVDWSHSSTLPEFHLSLFFLSLVV